MSHKKNKQKKPEAVSQSVASLTTNGLKAFRQNDFKKAIQTWEKEPVKLRPAALLAEANFRYGLALFYGTDSQTGISHLQAAADYLPGDPCYAYHLGLALQHVGDLPGALAAYKAVRQSPGPFAARSGYPLALALLRLGQDPAAAPSWNDLTAAEQATLRSMSVFQRRPYYLPPEAPLLWRALAALDRRDHAEALAGLEKVLAGDSSLAEKRIAHYYQGVLAARAEDWDAARRAWDAASAAGLHSERLDSNLAELYQRRAEDLLSQGDVQTALAAAQEARRHGAADKALDELLAQIHQQLGYQAASADRWEEAQSHWQSAVELDSASFRLVYNLALAYEKSANYILAGQTWREALRRRPRREDHPDALSDDRVARLWQRAAECYSKAGEFEEVGRTYQQAIKWAPDNLNLRLALAESLISEGRMQAGRNELARLLERNPEHIPALLRLGEAYFRDESAPWYVKISAPRCWEKVLKIDPQNSQAHQMLAEWFIDQGEISLSWGNYTEAAGHFQKALEYRPNHIETLLDLADCYLELQDSPRGEEYAAQALALAVDFDDFAAVIGFWLESKRGARALEITTQAEARFGKVPTDFYVAMAHSLIKEKRKEEAQAWLQRAVEKAAPEDSVFLMIGEMMMDFDAPLAMNYLQKAVGAGQYPGQAYLLMGMMEYKQGNNAASKKHFSEAQRIAHQTHDNELADRVKSARLFTGGAATLIDRLMRGMGDPGMLDDLLDAFGKEFK